MEVVVASWTVGAATDTLVNPAVTSAVETDVWSVAVLAEIVVAGVVPVPVPDKEYEVVLRVVCVKAAVQVDNGNRLESSAW